MGNKDAFIPFEPGVGVPDISRDVIDPVQRLQEAKTDLGHYCAARLPEIAHSIEAGLGIADPQRAVQEADAIVKRVVSPSRQYAAKMRGFYDRSTPTNAHDAATAVEDWGKAMQTYGQYRQTLTGLYLSGATQNLLQSSHDLKAKTLAVVEAADDSTTRAEAAPEATAQAQLERAQRFAGLVDQGVAEIDRLTGLSGALLADFPESQPISRMLAELGTAALSVEQVLYRLNWLENQIGQIETAAINLPSKSQVLAGALQESLPGLRDWTARLSQAAPRQKSS